MLISKKYLFVRYAKLYCLVFFTLVILLWLSQIVSIIEFLAIKGLNFFDFLGFSLLLIPRVVESIIPLVGVIVSIVLAFEMVGKRELFVLRAAGLSIKDISSPILSFTYFILIFSLVIHFFISPFAYTKYQNTRDSIKNSSFSFNFRESNISKIGKDAIIYSETIDDKQNIVFYHVNEGKENLLYADDGELLKLKDEILLDVKNGSLYFRDNKAEDFNVFSFAKFTTGTEIAENDNAALNKKHKDKSYTASKIYNDLFVTKSEDKAIRAELFRRISWSILSFLLPTLIFSICISGDFDRKYGIKKRVILAIFVTILAITSHFLLKHNFIKSDNITIYITIFFSILFIFWKIDIENNILFSKRARYKIS